MGTVTWVPHTAQLPQGTHRSPAITSLTSILALYLLACYHKQNSHFQNPPAVSSWEGNQTNRRQRGPCLHAVYTSLQNWVFLCCFRLFPVTVVGGRWMRKTSSPGGWGGNEGWLTELMLMETHIGMHRCSEIRLAWVRGDLRNSLCSLKR